VHADARREEGATRRPPQPHPHPQCRYNNPPSSTSVALNRQLHRAKDLINGHGGRVVAEYFDIGQSRSLPWKRRPEAARLLTDVADPSRGWEAVVIGEPSRAFYGGQFGLTFPVLTHYRVGLWVPEVGGAIDPGSEAHDLVMTLFGGLSKGERTRIKIRVRSAMEAMAEDGTRFLGGRPPTATAWPTPVPTRITPRRSPASGCIASSPTRPLRPLFGASMGCMPAALACARSPTP
jgi:DNA invertase Pin-like site-specific DNA recombinase